MTRKLNSLIEMAVVIGGLIAAPIVVLASSQSVAAAIAHADRGAPTIVHTAELKF